MKQSKQPGNLTELIDQCLQGLADKKTNCLRDYEKRLLNEFNLVLGALPNPMQLNNITIKPAPKENYNSDKLYDEHDHLQRLYEIIALKEHMLQNNIPFNAGSGRACGSLILYALGITEIDPIRFNLSTDHFYASLYRGDPLQVWFRVPAAYHKKMIAYTSKKYISETAKELFPPIDDIATWCFGQALQQINNLVFVINKNRSTPLLLEEISLDDQETFKLIASGNTAGIYALDGRIKKNHTYTSELEARNKTFLVDRELIKKVLQQRKPANFQEFMTVIALLQLVPISKGDYYLQQLTESKKDSAAVKHPHRVIGNAFSDTYGFPLYREQIFQLVNNIAGEKMRTFTEHNWKVFSASFIKREPWIFRKIRKKFIRHAYIKGYSKQSSYYLFNLIFEYVKHTTIKANTANQTLVAYRMTYLKAHYPELFQKHFDV